jgi:hypothetical protein
MMVLSAGVVWRTGVEERIAKWSLMPVGNGEGLQVLRYQNGQKYEAVSAALLAANCSQIDRGMHSSSQACDALHAPLVEAAVQMDTHNGSVRGDTWRGLCWALC